MPQCCSLLFQLYAARDADALQRMHRVPQTMCWKQNACGAVVKLTVNECEPQGVHRLLHRHDSLAAAATPGLAAALR